MYVKGNESEDRSGSERVTRICTRGLMRLSHSGSIFSSTFKLLFSRRILSYCAFDSPSHWFCSLGSRNNFTHASGTQMRPLINVTNDLEVSLRQVWWTGVKISTRQPLTGSLQVNCDKFAWLFDFEGMLNVPYFCVMKMKRMNTCVSRDVRWIAQWTKCMFCVFLCRLTCEEEREMEWKLIKMHAALPNECSIVIAERRCVSLLFSLSQIDWWLKYLLLSG